MAKNAMTFAVYLLALSLSPASSTSPFKWYHEAIKSPTSSEYYGKSFNVSKQDGVGTELFDLSIYANGDKSEGFCLMSINRTLSCHKAHMLGESIRENKDGVVNVMEN